MNIVTEHNPWWIVVCLLLGLLYSYVLYRNDEHLKELPKRLKQGMAALRFLLVSVLAFFLLNPLIKTLSRETEKPVIIIGQDNSASIVRNQDSAYYKGPYTDAMNALITSLSGDYDVKTYSFSSELSRGLQFDFSGKESDIAGFLDKIQNIYENRNVGAVIIATDGIYNTGNNPLYTQGLTDVPYYMVALGDTNMKKDLLISRIFHNKIAFLGNKFPVEIVVEAHKLVGTSSTLSISSDGKEIYKKEIAINKDDLIQKIPVVLDANKTGVRKYSLRLSRIDGEDSYSNNVRDIFVEVLDSRIKVLLLSAAPHPDVAAIKYAITSHENYEVETALAADFNKSPAGYNLLILNQLPSHDIASDKINELIERSNIPVLFVLGKNSDYRNAEILKSGLKISNSRNKINEVQAVVNKDFVLFKLSEKAMNTIEDFSPLYAPFGDYAINNDVAVLLYQIIGSITTAKPLILFRTSGNRKTGIITGEGLWKWRLKDFEINGDHEVFNELLGKTVQYLTVKEDKSRFRVNYRHQYAENERITFGAELYDDTYTPVNDPEVKMTITDGEGKNYDFVFSRTADAYQLDAGFLKPGIYTFDARTKFNEKIFIKKGEFSIKALMKETINSRADHSLLYRLAKMNDGSMIYPSEIGKLKEKLGQLDDLKSIFYTREKLQELINLKWVLFIILALLSAEWFLRKRNGYY